MVLAMAVGPPVLFLPPGMTGLQALTFGEAAGRLGVSGRELAELVVGGRLKVLPVGDVQLIPLREVQRLTAERERQQGPIV